MAKMDLDELVYFVEEEIEYLKKEWEGYDPNTAKLPASGYEYYQGMLKAYRQILAELERD